MITMVFFMVSVASTRPFSVSISPCILNPSSRSSDSIITW